jgi:CheY-like chemotaxis protein
MSECRILVVEDDEDIREALSALLELRGYTVAQAADGAAALRVAEATKPDVVVLDIGLPVLDGFAVAERLRSAPGPKPHIIGLSGFAQHKDFARAQQSGFDAYFAKPSAVSDVLDLIDRLASERARGQTGGGTKSTA